MHFRMFAVDSAKYDDSEWRRKKLSELKEVDSRKKHDEVYF